MEMEMQRTLAASRSARSMAAPPPPPPRSLTEELVEEILLRFPPEDPVRLVQAALVCKLWCAIVSGAGFRHRFCKFHRTPPLLGFFSDVHTPPDDRGEVEFVPTCSLPASQVHSRRAHVRVVAAHHGRILLRRISSQVHSRRAHVRVVAAHHGRILLRRISAGCRPPLPDVLMVWDPTTDVLVEVPIPAVARHTPGWAAAVLCAAGGPCDHLDCRQGPFLIVFVGYDLKHVETVLCTYSSSTASWSKRISSNQLPLRDYYTHYTFTNVAHVESALYSGVLTTDHILKFDLELHEISWIQLPSTYSSDSEWPYVLNTTEDGALGLATIHESKLIMWSRDYLSQVDATWTQSRVIELKTLLPVHAVLASPRVLGFTVGSGVVFVKSNYVLFAIDLKTHKVIKEVSEASDIYNIVPYMSFYTPALEQSLLVRDLQEVLEGHEKVKELM